MAIRSAIIDGQLRPGMRLIEGELAELLKVSRGPVREALRRLEQEGVVRIVPAGGTFVATLAEEDISGIYGLRAALEGYAARIAATVRADTSSLDEALDGMCAAFVARDLSGMIEADVAFHRSLVAMAGNPRLLAAWQALEASMRLILSLTRDQVYQDPERLADQHRALAEVIRAGAGEAAERRIREHIEGRIGERVASWRAVAARQAQDAAPASYAPGVITSNADDDKRGPGDHRRTRED